MTPNAEVIEIDVEVIEDEPIRTPMTVSGDIEINAGVDEHILTGVQSWNGQTGNVVYEAPVPPVTSVNGQTGNVQIAIPDSYTKGEVDLLLSGYVEPDDLANVAVTGDYSDLLNKPAIPTVPTKVSAFDNDAGYLTQHQSLSGYATETWVQNQGYLTQHQSLAAYATIAYVDSLVGDIENLLEAI